MDFERIVNLRSVATVALALGLNACGGGGGDTNGHAHRDRSTPSDSSEQAQPGSEVPPSEITIALQRQGGQLNAAELAQIAKSGVLPKAFPGKSLSGAEDAKSFSGGTTKSAASRVPTYRFYNTRTAAHFFTTSETERANVQATLPFMSFEGPAFSTSSTAIPGLSPVHRFYNTATGVHFYTISESERAHVAATLPQFNYEGVAYHASTLPGTGYTPLYRFFYASKGFHFYTNSAAEKDNIIATLPQYNFEGIGYYVLGDDWQTPAVPHTGITAAQCYAEGADTLVTCTPSVKAINMGGTSVNLNPQQDGHRRNINPMSYSRVVGQEAQNCVTDNVTGLVWERAASTGEYTNLGNGALTDTSSYITAINRVRLCGFTDWRLPSIEELQGIADYGVLTLPRIDTTAFLDTSATKGFWSSDILPSLAGHGMYFDFEGPYQQVESLSVPLAVRLVRGAPWTWSMGNRHLITSVAYAGDVANNAVLDRKTGLTWRRCLEKWTWNGSTCTHPALSQYGFRHEAALIHAASQSGWRVPNVKELGSLLDHSRVNPAQDLNLFPGTDPDGAVWSSSPYVGDAYYARFVGFNVGDVGSVSRGDGSAVRLVRASQ